MYWKFNLKQQPIALTFFSAFFKNELTYFVKQEHYKAIKLEIYVTIIIAVEPLKCKYLYAGSTSLSDEFCLVKKPAFSDHLF